MKQTRIILLCTTLLTSGALQAQSLDSTANADKPRIVPDSCAPVVYPAESRSANETGSVVLEFLVGTDGRVRESKIQSSSGHARLDKAALDALSQCRFTPMQRNGKAEAAWTSLRYTWKLEDDSPYATVLQLDEAIKKEPGKASLYISRGATLYSLGQTDRALTDFDAALRLEPRSFEAYIGRSMLRLDKAQYDPALADINKAIEIRPASAEAYLARGKILLSKGETERALKDVDFILGFNPDIAAAHALRSALMLKRGDIERGIADASRAIQLDPRLANAYVTRSFLHAAKGDFPQAYQDANYAIETGATTVVDAYYSRAIALHNLGELERAIADYSVALRLSPQFAEAYFGRGVAWMHRGETEHGQADLQQALTLKPQLAASLPKDPEASDTPAPDTTTSTPPPSPPPAAPAVPRTVPRAPVDELLR